MFKSIVGDNSKVDENVTKLTATFTKNAEDCTFPPSTTSLEIERGTENKRNFPDSPFTAVTSPDCKNTVETSDSNADIRSSPFAETVGRETSRQILATTKNSNNNNKPRASPSLKTSEPLSQQRLKRKPIPSDKPPRFTRNLQAALTITLKNPHEDEKTNAANIKKMNSSTLKCEMLMYHGDLGTTSSSSPPLESKSNSRSKSKIHPTTATTSTNTNTNTDELNSTDNSNSAHSSSSSAAKLKIVKFIRGESKTVIHTTMTNFSNELLNLDGKYLKKYYSEILEKEKGGGRVKLPFPSIVKSSTDDEDCITFEIYRYSSIPNTVFRTVQQFMRIPSSEEIIDIGFWSVTNADEILIETSSNNLANVNYFKEHGLTIINGEYSERGKFRLSTLPHGTSNLVYTVEVGCSEESLSLFAFTKKLQSALDVAKDANIYFDRGSIVDKLEIEHYVNVIMPAANQLTDEENEKIKECSKTLKLEDKDIKWRRLGGAQKGAVEKFQLNDGKRIMVKGKVTIDEKAEIILGWIMHFVNNERVNRHMEENGNNLERTWNYVYETHTCQCTIEMPSPPPLKNRRFDGCQI